MAEMTGGATDVERPGENAPLVDVSGLSLANLRERAGGPLAEVLKRVLADLTSDTDAVAGFQSGI